MRNYTHKSNTTGRIRTFYSSNDCSTMCDISTLLVRAVCELLTASYGFRHASQPLSDTVLYVFTLVTSKLQVVWGRSTYRMPVLLSEMSIICRPVGINYGLLRQDEYHANNAQGGGAVGVSPQDNLGFKASCDRLR